ncbi:response regulator transcription factor [Bacillus sp. USDA818B3_A]|uniref:response regulator transcription factor n=1 Tax=Bacillus sp. USDA818B3_A TaxID=2698834 RepID=UPI00136FC922|nr:response regulator transcription factor [Bacillus sp. USDA818B3_A]
MDGRVLIIEDDDAIASVIGTYLRKEGFQTEWIDNGHDALTAASSGEWDLILLDVMLPGLDGFEICMKLRTLRIDVPVIFLTARGEEVDQVLGLGLGADDYITKPFSGLALTARVKAHLRRYRELKGNQANNETDVLIFSDLEIDLGACVVRREGREITLSAKEYELLRFLISRPGQVFTKEQIFSNVWSDGYYTSDDNTVMVHIRRLREKIEADPSKPRYVITVRGLGYRFAKDA